MNLRSKFDENRTRNESAIAVTCRVVGSEIFSGKFQEIYSNLSGNLLITYISRPFPSPALQRDAVK